MFLSLYENTFQCQQSVLQCENFSPQVVSFILYFSVVFVHICLFYALKTILTLILHVLQPALKFLLLFFLLVQYFELYSILNQRLRYLLKSLIFLSCLSLSSSSSEVTALRLVFTGDRVIVRSHWSTFNLVLITNQVVSRVKMQTKSESEERKTISIFSQINQFLIIFAIIVSLSRSIKRNAWVSFQCFLEDKYNVFNFVCLLVYCKTLKLTSVHIIPSLCRSIITVTISSNVIGALPALFFTNHSVQLLSNSVIQQLAVMGYLLLDS